MKCKKERGKVNELQKRVRKIKKRKETRIERHELGDKQGEREDVKERERKRVDAREVDRVTVSNWCRLFQK